MQHLDSARHAMNCAVTAHHMADWVWGDFVKGDAALKTNLGVKDKNDFMAWIDGQTVWYGLVQSISNGSKHFIRDNAKGTQKVQGFGGWVRAGALRHVIPSHRSQPDRPEEHGSVDVVRGRNQVLAGFSQATRSI